MLRWGTFISPLVVSHPSDKGEQIHFFKNASSLTHLCQVHSSTLTLQIGPFPIEGGLASCYDYMFYKKFLYLMQIV